MAKKSKEVEKLDLTVGNIKVGTKLPDLHGEEVEITDDLIEQMRRFEKESKKNAIFKNKVTGSFLYFKYFEDNPKEVKPKKKPKAKKVTKVVKELEINEEEELEEIEVEDEDEDLEEELEEELEDELIEVEVNEEDLLLDCIEDYKAEYNVKNVKTSSQKFKQFFYKWKQSK